MQSNIAKWTNSEVSYNEVSKEIEERWGKTVLSKYKPQHSCRTFGYWLSKSYAVKKGEKAIKTNATLDIVGEDGQLIATISVPVNLFHRRQIRKIPRGKRSKSKK